MNVTPWVNKDDEDDDENDEYYVIMMMMMMLFLSEPNVLQTVRQLASFRIVSAYMWTYKE